MKRLVAYFCLCLLCTALWAQEKNWNGALDQYEEICNECISLRSRSMAGERVSSASVSQLLGQLATLRKTLQQAGGEMTREQRLRYDSIRRRYDRAFGNRTEPLHAVPFRSFPYLLPVVPETDRPSPVPTYPGPAVSQEKPTLTWAGYLFVCIPDWAPGVMATVSSGKWGAYVKGSSTLVSQKADYSCYADGTTDTGYIWTTGEEKRTRFSVTAGGLFSPLPFLSIYAGAGYGSRTLFWKDTSGRWAQVKDRSSAHIALDAGLLFSWKHFSVMTGVSTIGFNHPMTEAEIGVGWRF